ncbi:MAG TPA: PBP1A family penicillin-binding protein, partial [Bryobacteraceae bacterium]|nr:PBP1A family penicillin-binding protein [Bryobacteraceae bacterium]
MRSRIVAFFRRVWAALRSAWPPRAVLDWQRAVVWAAAAFVGAVVLVHLYVVFWAVRYGFEVHGLHRGIGDTVFYDGRGKPWFPMDEQRRDVPLARISPHIRRAVVAVEDHRFYSHGGIDPIGVARAVFLNARAGRRTQGGSTITQQLARTLFLSNERTWARKGKEAIAALVLETLLTKDQILEFYLNRIYLSGGVYGVENIARRLLGKPASDVNLAEAALIAGVIRAPSALSPWDNYDGALARSRVVLARMEEEKFITPEIHRTALGMRPGIQPRRSIASRHGYAKEYLRGRFRDQFDGDHPPNWKVYTTLLPDFQEMAERAVERSLARRAPGLQAALVALRPDTGDIIAMVGGRDYSDSQYNRAVRSRRQPGSAFKPFVYAAALSRGYSPVSVLSGLASIPSQGKEEWIPRNAHENVPDELTLRAALLESDNRAAVLLQQKISTRPVLRVAYDLGIREQPDVPSLALGSGVVTPLQLTAAYAAFPNGGFAVAPRGIVRVVDAQGDIAFDREVRREQVLTPEVAWQMTSMLTDVLDRGTGASARQMGVTFPAAGKTGTTNEFRDAWFVGYTTSLVVGVWVGYDQPQPIGREAFAARVALPIWADFMRSASRVAPARPFRVPAGMKAEQLCRVSYLQPMEDCPVYTEYFKDGDDVPSRLCPVHSG